MTRDLGRWLETGFVRDARFVVHDWGNMEC